MKDKIINTFEGTTKVVGIINMQGIIYVATEYQVFKLVDDKLIPLEIIFE